MSDRRLPVDGNSLLESQVKELYRSSNMANLMVFAIATFLSLILWPVADPTILTLWYVYTFGIALVRAVITFQYKKQSAPSPRLWLNLHSIGLFLAGLGWGAVLLFVVPVSAQFHLISAIFVIAGLATASAGSMASVKHGFAVFSIPALLPGALKLIVLNDDVTVLIGCGICVFLIFIAVIALRLHEVILYHIRKQFESARFVVEVQEIHEALISRYDELESQLQRSTQKIQELQAQLQQNNPESIASDAERKTRGDKFNYLLDKLHGGAWNFNLTTREIRFSPQWLNMLGYKEDEVYATLDFWKSLLHPDEAAEVGDKLQAHLSGRLPQYFSSHRLRTRGGEWKWVFSRAQPVAWGTFGEVLDMVCVEIDIEDPETYLARKLSSVNFRASDWLYSEAMFMQRLQYAVQTTVIESVEHALCHISVTAAGLAPDSSRQPGNELSKQLANILIRACRQEDPVLDLGNNCFAVLLENLSIDKALNKAASLRKTIDAHSFDMDGRSAAVSTAIGITPIFDTRRTESEIFEDAETACRIARNDTPDSIFVFQRDDAEHGANSLERRILTKVEEILDKRGLVLTHVALKPLALFAGNAAKLSWLTAALPGLTNYAAVIKDLHDPASANALASAFDRCVIRMLHDWALAQAKSPTQQVHIYECRPVSLFDAGFVSLVRELFGGSAASGHSLCLGISEATFTAHRDQVLAFIEALRPAGIKFALTDFGVGAISFDYMKGLPVDYLELHETLLAGIASDKTSFVTIKYLNEIGHVLNFRTLALGTGSELHETALRGIGVDYIRNFAPELPLPPGSNGTAARGFTLDTNGLTH